MGKIIHIVQHLPNIPPQAAAMIDVNLSSMCQYCYRPISTINKQEKISNTNN